MWFWLEHSRTVVNFTVVLSDIVRSLCNKNIKVFFLTNIYFLEFFFNKYLIDTGLFISSLKFLYFISF
jgi:hypothetical protein